MLRAFENRHPQSSLNQLLILSFHLNETIRHVILSHPIPPNSEKLDPLATEIILDLPEECVSFAKILQNIVSI